jgi:hypothetical protein
MDDDHCGDELQNLLSELSSLKNDFPADTIVDVPGWIWSCITINKSQQDDSSAHTVNKWTLILQKIREECLPNITPLELHAIASQSIIFEKDDDENDQQTLSNNSPFRILCLLLCVAALQKCPSPLTGRYRRWQSVVCETIRLFQTSYLDVDNSDVDMDRAIEVWVHFLCVAALHVVSQISKHVETAQQELLFTGMFAGIVGTTAMLTERKCTSSMTQSICFVTVEALLQSIGSTVIVFDEISSNATILDEMTIWLSPWRFYYHNKQQQQQRHQEIIKQNDIESSEEDDDDDFEKNRHQLSWWIYRASKQDQMANMDTSWSNMGISVLAMAAFQERAMVYSASFLWTVWFPHVTQNLKEASHCPNLREPSLTFLQSLLQCVPVCSLTIKNLAILKDNTPHERPELPLEIIQVLSDQMVMVSQVNGHKTSDNQAQRRKHVAHIASLVTGVLHRYQPSDQVVLLDKLVHDCPNPGLQARYLDLLRPLLSDTTCHALILDLLKRQVDKLLLHMNLRPNPKLSDIDGLIENAEVFVSTVSLIQRFCMANHAEQPPIFLDAERLESLRLFHEALVQQNNNWISGEPNNAPEHFYRLYLLQDMLQNVLNLQKKI